MKKSGDTSGKFYGWFHSHPSKEYKTPGFVQWKALLFWPPFSFSERMMENPPGKRQAGGKSNEIAGKAAVPVLEGINCFSVFNSF